MARRRKLLLLCPLAIAVAGALAVAARMLAPGWIRGRIERAGRDAFGREVRITGGFRLVLPSRVIAEEVTITNAPWGTEPFLLRSGRVEARVELESLWSPPLRIVDLTLEDTDVRLESGPDGRGNWQSAEPSPRDLPPAETGQPRPVVFDRLAIRRLTLTRRTAGEPQRLVIARLDAERDPETEAIRLDTDGRLDETPFHLAGTMGSLDSLAALHDVTPEVSGRFGDVEFSFRGRVRDPMELGGPNFEAEVSGPDVAAAADMVGLHTPLTGSFRLAGGAEVDDTPAAGGSIGWHLNGDLAGLRVAAEGHADRLLKPAALDGSVTVSGPDATRVGSWTGIAGLPPGPFEVSGRFRSLPAERSAWFPISVEDGRVRAGMVSAGLRGTIGAPPRWVGTDLAITGSGPDLRELSALTRQPLPAGPFEVRGRFLRRPDALAVDGVEIRVAGAIVRAGGTIGEPPACEALDLKVAFEGRDLSAFSGVARVGLPSERFRASGRVARRGRTLAVERANGSLRDAAFTADAVFTGAARLSGTRLHGQVSGPDVSLPAALIGLHDVPARPYDIAGEVLLTPEGYAIDGIEAHVGELSASGAGRLGRHPGEDGTSVDFRLAGPSLDELADWGARALPDDPFSASGRLRIEGGVYLLDHAVIESRGDRLALNGTVGALPDPSLFDAEVDLSGPRLSALARFAGTDSKIPPLPAEPYTLTGRFRHAPAGYGIEAARGTLSNAEVRLEGTIGSGAGYQGTNLHFDARAPDAVLAAELTGLALPEGPVALAGQLARDGQTWRLEGVTASDGDAQAEIFGTVGEPPSFADSDVRLRVRGPDFAAVAARTGFSAATREPFDASARLVGSLDAFRATALTAVIGASDLAGTISVRRGDRPVVAAEVSSKHLDLARIGGWSGGSPGSAETAVSAADQAGSSRSYGSAASRTAPPAATGDGASGGRRGGAGTRRGGLLISDEPLSLDGLKRWDGTIQLEAEDLILPWNRFQDAALVAELKDGALQASRLEGTNPSGGRITGTLSLAPVAEGYRLRATGDIAGGVVDFSGPDTDPDHTPPVDVEFSFEGSGPSLHAIAAGADGHALITWGEGRVPRSLARFRTSDVLQQLLDALNPFRKTSPMTTFECGVVSVNLQGGQLVAAPIATETDKLIVLGRGRVNLDTEQLDLVWTIKPRSGVGITGNSIANPYIKLGGTLAAPALSTKPVEAIASTGAAVMTSGLSLLVRGIYDRITAQQKVCIKALDVAKDQAEKRAARKARAERNGTPP